MFETSFVRKKRAGSDHQQAKPFASDKKNQADI